MPKRPIDKRIDFLSSVSLIPGLGPKRVAALKSSGIETIGQLLYHFPRRYVDRSTVTPIGDIAHYAGTTCTVIGTVTRTRVERGRRPRFRIQVADESGSFEALWFHGIQFFRKSISTGKRLLLTGTVGAFGGYQMVHPMVESVGANADGAPVPYLPHYPLTEAMREVGFQQKALFRAIQWVLDNLEHYPQVLPRAIEEKKRFPPLAECIARMHMPENPDLLEPYAARLRYEELYRLALTLRYSKRTFALPGRAMKPGALAGQFKKHLSFQLTADQESAIETLYRDAAASRRMHRLLQGDVGCGKTVVAFCACLPALNEGYQVAWMAPTEVLAQQSFGVISEWLGALGFEAALLTGSTSASGRRAILSDLSSGGCRFVVGTHALLQPIVKFQALGMIVIDEQHKFGAEQRLRLAEKDESSDLLLMSATPIPQTLAKTLYGDLDIVSIRSLPQGRLPVSTHIVSDAKRADMERYIAAEIADAGRQAFYLVARIDTDGQEQVKDINTVFASFERGAFRAVSKVMLHGRMSAEEKASAMRRFAAGEVQLLVATSVVEVGVDVPNATIMVIENAERFGLSQLHQLRGRAARGLERGYCFLLSGDGTDEQTLGRLRCFCKTHDGFEIAELDLSLRGPGEVVGFRQSGWEELKMADVLRDASLFREIQEYLDTIQGT